MYIEYYLFLNEYSTDSIYICKKINRILVILNNIILYLIKFDSITV